MLTDSMFSSLIETNPETETLVSLITALAETEKIFLLGSTESRKRTGSIFNYEQPSCISRSHYYILLLVNKADEQSLIAVQDKIENNLQHFIPVTAIVLCTEQFNSWLSEGHAFARTVAKRALLVFDRGDTLAEVKTMDAGEINSSRQHYYTKGLNMMQEFLAGAEMYRIRKQHAMAAFMLHQSLEHGLRCLVKATTGLSAKTHNIDRLARLCSMAVHGLTELFCRTQQKEKSLFSKLQAAYIDARYKEYSIDQQELLAIEERIKQLLQIYRQVSKEIATA